MNSNVSLKTEQSKDALFSAKEVGAFRTRIRRAAGLTSAHLKNALLSATKLSDQARGKVEELDRQLTDAGRTGGVGLKWPHRGG